MFVEVKLYATLQKNRFQKKRIQMQSGLNVTDLLNILEISTDDVGMLVINRKDATFHQQLNDGDTICIIPPIGGG